MPSTHARVSKDELLKAAERLNLAELNDFVAELIDLRAHRIAPSIAPDEAVLLEEICKGLLPEEKHVRYHVLRKKLERGILTKKEHKELLRLSDESENRNAKRMEALLNLSQLRRLPLNALVDQLGITPCTHE